MNTITEALEELQEYLTTMGSCGDGNCIVLKPRGMHTNGGCRCSNDQYRMQKYAYAMNRFVDKVSKSC